MESESQPGISTDQIIQVMRDFMRLRLKFKALLPEELSRLRNRLDEMPPRDEAPRSANHELFFRVGSILCQKSNLTMGELSSALSVPLSTATRMIDWMVDNGYATRLPDPEDRRIVRVALTDTGRQLFNIAEGYVVQRVQHILSGLTSKEQVALFSLINKAISALEEL